MGKALELALTLAFEREAAAVPRVGQPLRTGVSAAMWRTSQALSLAGLASSLLSTRRSVRRTAGFLGTLGALVLRFAVLQAGRASARDPHAPSTSSAPGVAPPMWLGNSRKNAERRRWIGSASR